MTERRRAANAEAQLSAIVRRSHDAVIGESLDGITSWDAGAERLYGYTVAEMTGRTMEELIPPGLRAAEVENLARIARGTHRAVRLRAHPQERQRGRDLADGLADLRRGGRIIGAARMSRDVSDRGRAEPKFRARLEAAPDAVVGGDAETGPRS